MVLPRGKGGTDGEDGAPDRSRSPMKDQNGDGGWNNSWSNDGGGNNSWNDSGGDWKKKSWNDGGGGSWKDKKDWNSGGGEDKREICRFFQKAGWCKSGDNCQYRHVQGQSKGDWDCPQCGDKQFARNLKCRKCGAARPGGTTGDAEMDAEATQTENYINAIKLYQRESEEHQETWWWFCDIQGYKERYDPRRKDLSFLKDFCASQHVPVDENAKITNGSEGPPSKGGGKGDLAGLSPAQILAKASPGMPSPAQLLANMPLGLNMTLPGLGLGQTMPQPGPDMNAALQSMMAAFPNLQPPAGLMPGMSMPGMS